MVADQKDDQKVFLAKQRELLMNTKDLSKHAIHADVTDLEESLERGENRTKKILSHLVTSSFSRKTVHFTCSVLLSIGTT